MFQITTATKRIAELTKAIRGVAGGTSASKTISILAYLIDYGQSHENELISVTSESMPHLRRGARRDFQDIMKTQRYWRDSDWNESNSIYTFRRGKKEDGTEWQPSQMEFFSADKADKQRGARRDVLFINEANNIPFETFNQIEPRTRKFTFLDWNPSHEFWWYTDVMPYFDVDFITLTYKDNEALDQKTIDSIEARKHLTSWYKVYGLGQLGEVEEKIYTGWGTLDDVPATAKLYKYGLDFGYTNDPTAIVAIYEWNGGYVLDEIAYQTGMDNKKIVTVFESIDSSVVIADSSEPKSIDEIKKHGIVILPASKGKDSLLHGIQYLQQQKIFVTKRSLNILKEYRNYLWLRDPKTDKILNEPIDDFNHAMDAIRYAIVDKKKQVVWKPTAGYGGIKPLYDGLPA